MGDCPEDVIVPVILLPGIMGSRLEHSGSTVWDPDDSMLMVRLYGANAGTVVGPDLFRMRESSKVRAAAAVRKRLLVGSRFSKSFLNPVEFGPVDGLSQDRIDRNWSSVALGTYGKIMKDMEDSFPIVLNNRIKEINPKFNLVKMPVYACGYNWSQSNDDSGKAAAAHIKTWVDEAKNWAAENNAQCPGAVLVTHSMGGFVARAACLSHGAASDVMAVMSTVMPTDGAAATYKRFHFGFENTGWSMSKAAVEGMVGYVVLGRQGALVTSLLGNMPGAQELLPNKRYKTNSGSRKWLAVMNPERNMIGNLISGGGAYANLPNSNPYTEIYRREDRMWRAANPEWMFPEGMGAGAATQDPFDEFVKHNETAEAWHDAIIGSGDFHELTYTCHSADPAMKTYDAIRWRPDKTGGSLGRSVSERDVRVATGDTPDYHREHLRTGSEDDKHIDGPILGADWVIELADGAGDRTVPASASYYALGISSSRRTAHTRGYEHEPAIHDSIVINWVRDTMVTVLGDCELY